MMKNGINRIAGIAAALALVSAPAVVRAQGSPYMQNIRSGGEPFVKLDKTRFIVGENIFFWVGINPTQKNGLIPKEFQGTCRLLVTRPDGTQKTLPSSWPVDGPANAGWMGGAGIQEKAVVGTYKIAFEFAGQKSAPATFTVEEDTVLKKVQALFVFDTPEDGDTSVILTVRNSSDQTIRFPHRNGVNGSVWVHYSGIDVPGSTHTWFPPEKLLDTDEPKAPNFSFDKFTWELARKVATVTLKPGETYRQTLSLHDAAAWARTQSDLPPGRYSIKFGTQLQLLIGEPDGKYAGISPVRHTIETTGEAAIP